MTGLMPFVAKVLVTIMMDHNIKDSYVPRIFLITTAKRHMFCYMFLHPPVTANTKVKINIMTVPLIKIILQCARI